MYIILSIIFLSAAGVLADAFVKSSGQGSSMNVKIFLVGLFIYTFSTFGWFFVMKHIKLSSLGVIYSLSTVLLLVAVGVFYFHEKLNTAEIVGILAAVLAIALLSRFA